MRGSIEVDGPALVLGDTVPRFLQPCCRRAWSVWLEVFSARIAQA